MPVEFLSDGQTSIYGRFTSGFTRTELERYFFLDDVDRALIEPKRREHNKLGFAVQLATVRYVGRFLDDPLDGVPVELIEYLEFATESPHRCLLRLPNTSMPLAGGHAASGQAVQSGRTLRIGLGGPPILDLVREDDRGVHVWVAAEFDRRVASALALALAPLTRRLWSATITDSFIRREPATVE